MQFVILIVGLVFLNLPVALILMAICLLFFYTSDVHQTIQIQRMVASQNFVLLAVPLFILAGHMMEASKITSKLFLFLNSVLSHIKGGLAYVNIVASMFMAGMSGSALADCAITTKIFVPQMHKAGYPKAFSCAITAASSTIGPVIPPSILFVIYGWLSNTSIASLFLAGVVPGVLMGLFLIIASYFIVSKSGYGVIKNKSFFSLKESIRLGMNAFIAILMPVFVLGLMIFGIVTPTEAGGVAVAYSAIVGFFIYRSIKLKDLPNILINASKDTARIMIVIAAANSLSWILTFKQIPQIITILVMGLTENKIILLILLNLFLFLAGTVMSTSAILIIVVPIVLPLIMKMDVSPVHFGVVIVVNLLVGGLTPPFGTLMFSTCSIAKITIVEFLKSAWLFIIALAILVFILTFVPSISLWLPNLVK
jgi:tripartite ATP-independent transporter DctM subunit